jgi:hypothetical protein
MHGRLMLAHLERVTTTPSGGFVEIAAVDDEGKPVNLALERRYAEWLHAALARALDLDVPNGVGGHAEPAEALPSS